MKNIDINKNLSLIINGNSTPFAISLSKTIEDNSIVLFPKNEYHFGLEESSSENIYVSNNSDLFPKRIAFHFKSKNNIVLDGQGSSLILDHQMMLFVFENCSNIKLKNFKIDYKRPIHSDSTIVSIGNNSFILSFEEEMTYHIDDNGKFSFVVDGQKVEDWANYCFDGKTKRSKYRIADNGFGVLLSKSKAVEKSKGLVEFVGKINKSLVVGDQITFRHNDRNNVAIFINKSKDIIVENVSVYHSGAMALVGQRSENIEVSNCEFIPKPNSKRVSSIMADATHFSGCKGLINVHDCVFKGMMDDAINVHGTSLKITKVNKETNSTIFKFMHEQSIGMEVVESGDELKVVDNRTMMNVSNLTVSRVNVIDSEHQEVFFNEKLSDGIKENFALENISWTPEVIFRNNKVSANRARGMLFNTPRKCLVEKNWISTSGSAVLIAGDSNYWFESGAVGELGPTIIDHNVFEDCLTNMYQYCDAIISIHPEIPELVKDKYYHKHIEITNNVFKTFDAPILFAKSVEKLKFEGNMIKRTNSFEPWHPNNIAFKIINCGDLNINHNDNNGQLISTEIGRK